MADFSSGKRNRSLELNKALTILGFGTWNSLEPGKAFQYCVTNWMMESE